MIWEIQVSRPIEKATDASALFSFRLFHTSATPTRRGTPYFPAVAENKIVQLGWGRDGGVVFSSQPFISQECQTCFFFFHPLSIQQDQSHVWDCPPLQASRTFEIAVSAPGMDSY